jgi:hypothetical protein
MAKGGRYEIAALATVGEATQVRIDDRCGVLDPSQQLGVFDELIIIAPRGMSILDVHERETSI